ncbi:MAG TPA: oligopeptide transporter, OPT family, partial [Candidatus Binataceae bacterium]|nr:oligopeptide transporter, OPT family [Candidatus Binataceae bacterium]
GLACAQVLRAGADNGVNTGGAAALAWGGVLSAVIKAAQDVAGIIPGSVAGARWLGGAAVSASLNLSGALLGVGFIIGPRIASLVFIGGAINWIAAIPIVTAFHPELYALAAADAAHQVWSERTRYLGVGAMLVGGVVTLWRLRVAIGRGLREAANMLGSRCAESTVREERDLPAGYVFAAISLCLPMIFALCYGMSGSLALSVILTVALALIGFFATAIAGYLTGIVGASNNPVSGVTIIVLLAIAIVLKFAGVSAAIGPRLAIMAGAVVCTAAAMAGDSLHDLATGYHVRATPRSLEISVLFGAITSSFVMAPVLTLLIRGYGIVGTPTAHAQALAAPQAFLMAKVAQGVFHGDLPLSMIAAGAALALALAILDGILERRGSAWRTPIMPVAIGLYLPFGLSVAILLGALLRFVKADDNESGRSILFAAGLIAGEALMGVAGGALVTFGIKLPLF